MKLGHLFESDTVSQDDIDNHSCFWNPGFATNPVCITDLPSNLTREQLNLLWNTTFPLGSPIRKALDHEGCAVFGHYCSPVTINGYFNNLTNKYNIEKMTWAQYAKQFLEIAHTGDFTP